MSFEPATSEETRHPQPEARSRMVSFRLTAEEYERFRTLCAARGLPNVSEMVRSAVHQFISQDSAATSPAAPAIQVSRLLSRLDSLEARLHALESSTAFRQFQNGLTVSQAQ